MEIAAQVLDRDVLSDVGAGHELHAFGGELLDAAVHQMLFELEGGNAVAQQAPDAVGLFENSDLVSGAAQLLRGGQARRSGADDGDALAGGELRGLRTNPAFLEAALDDVLLDFLDSHRRLVDAEHAGGFAGRGANAAGEFREIVGGVQLADRLAPQPAIDEVVPVGDEIVERASGVAEGHAAIHAARALHGELVLGKVAVNLEPVVDALDDRAARGQLAGVFHETGGLTHAAPARSQPAWRLVRGCRGARCARCRARACTRAGKP